MCSRSFSHRLFCNLRNLRFKIATRKTNIIKSSGSIIKSTSCGGGEANLLITEGESSVALVLRKVPFLVVDGKIGTLGYPFLPIVDKVQQAEYFK